MNQLLQRKRQFEGYVVGGILSMILGFATAQYFLAIGGLIVWVVAEVVVLVTKEQIKRQGNPPGKIIL